MPGSGLHYVPVAWSYFLLLAVLYGLVIATVVRFASMGMGVKQSTVLAMLFLSLAGSYFNIPVATLPERQIVSHAVVSFFGVPYVVPVLRDWPATVVAVNLGGAVIPILLSAYLMARNRLYALGLAGTAAVALVCYLLARPIPGVGIGVPVFVPPVVTAAVAIVLSRRRAAPLAYISGSLGTLLGADLMNLGRIRGLGAPIASIGGAGTFDGIFVTGLLAVVYASVFTYLENARRARSRGR